MLLFDWKYWLGDSVKKNITIICLANEYKKRVAKALADELEMFYADVNEIMEYNLINDEMLEKAGQQYFDENESKTVKTIASYDNTILTLNFSTLNKGGNLNILKKESLIIYIKLSFEKFCKLNKFETKKSLVKINELAFEDRNAYIADFCDILVDPLDLELTSVVENIIQSINHYFA